MENEISVSPSRLNTYLDCHQAYVGRYIYGLKDEGHPKTRLGSAIHDLFECVSRPKSVERRKKYIYFSHKQKLLHPVIRRALDGLYVRHNVPEIIPDTKLGMLNLHNYGRQLVLDTFRAGYGIETKVLAVEYDFKIRVADKVYIRGFIDRVDEVDSVTLNLKDYKSGKPFSVNACRKEFQPFFYILASQNDFPQYRNYIFSFHFLANKKIITVEKTPDELAKFKNFIISQGYGMLKLNKTNATFTKSWQCKNCASREPNEEKGYSGCPAFYGKDGKYLFKNYAN